MLVFLIISVLSQSLVHYLAFILLFIPIHCCLDSYHTKTSDGYFVLLTLIYIVTVIVVNLLGDWQSVVYTSILGEILLMLLLIMETVTDRDRK